MKKIFFQFIYLKKQTPFFEMQILGNVLFRITLIHTIYHDTVLLRSN